MKEGLTSSLALARRVARAAAPARAVRAAAALPSYAAQWRRYRRLPGAEPLRLIDAAPFLLDRVPTTPYDPHYLHQAYWATRRIVGSGASAHADVGSQVMFVALLAVHVPVTFVDIRPLDLDLPGLTPILGDVTALPFEDESIASLSCLHVAEHVGLGRYGDELDPAGTRRACAELARVLAPGGSLYFSVPVGSSRVCFNAHRIHHPDQIREYFSSLSLDEFAVVDDSGGFREDVTLAGAGMYSYACGLFRFRRPRD